MPDRLDDAQQLAADLAAGGVAAHAKRARTVGLTHCEDEGCGEAIAPHRTAMGARLCIGCANAAEARATHLSTWGRR